MREDEDKDEDEDVNMDTMPTNKEETTSSGAQNGDAAEQGQGNNNNASAPALPETHLRRSTRIREKQQRIRPEWKIQVPFENPTQQERWDSGDVAAVYSRALETLRQLHGDFDRKDGGLSDEEDEDSKALATTIGKLERAGKAVRVVEQLAGHTLHRGASAPSNATNRGPLE
ncbi:hypothetical protein KEM55_003723 [Ascosphaera atra]|nr:hypothetical protein KEM55_003723 [Ascosphaera atra]